ncbi:hypothetical protein RD792_001888 [Penstemon davidsonii]|uniref:Uncharacterized protein n=1 Tax=Penstemon davidsonii TaxID=160366 RepID=A0ABR0DQS7_9LAMI|nr:hypothetical protein RD792_001888 [Penstemon davidsonii]
MENQLELEKNKAKEREIDTLETRRQGHWSCPHIFELSDKDVADLTEKFGNFKVRMDDLLQNHGPSQANPNTNMYPNPNIQNLYAPDHMNHVAGTGTDGINFPRPNQIGTSYFGLPSHNYDMPGSSDLPYYGSQEGSIFLRGLDTPFMFNNMTGNLNESNFSEIPGPSVTNNLLDIPGPSGTNNLIDIPPGSSGTNIMYPISNPMWEQISTFTFTPASRSSSSTITLPGNPNIGNATPYVLQPGNSMVPPMQDNLENMFQRMYNNNYNGDGNYTALNQGNVQNMFQGTSNNINSGNYTVPNQGNVQNIFQGTFNNNNTGIYTMPNLQGNVQNMFQGTFNYNNNGNGNENFTVPYPGNVQNMFQGLNNNNSGYGNSTAPGQNNDTENMIQEFNRKNGQGN